MARGMPTRRFNHDCGTRYGSRWGPVPLAAAVTTGSDATGSRAFCILVCMECALGAAGLNSLAGRDPDTFWPD